MVQRIRIVVPVHNEKTLLPWFLGHYKPLAASIVVWDNGSTDGSDEIARAAGAEVNRFETEGYDEQAVLERLHETLDASRSYDWVMLPDVDEFIVGRDLQKVLERTTADIVAAAGFNLVAHEEEPPLDATRPLVGQRRFGYPSEMYTKPIIVRPISGARFSAGKHKVKNYDETPGKLPGVALLHHDMIDFDLWVYRKTKRPLSARNRKHGWSTLRFCREPEFYLDYWAEQTQKAQDLGCFLEAIR